MDISFSGHRNFDDKILGETLSLRIGELIAEARALGEQITFWSGVAVGFDLAAAEAVLAQRGCEGDVRLCCVVPYIGQALYFNSRDFARYESVLQSADRVVTLAEEYSRDVFFRRNDYLVERADLMIVYYDGERGSGTHYTVRRAYKEKVAVENLYPQPQLTLF